MPILVAPPNETPEEARERIQRRLSLSKRLLTVGLPILLVGVVLCYAVVSEGSWATPIFQVDPGTGYAFRAVGTLGFPSEPPLQITWYTAYSPNGTVDVSLYACTDASCSQHDPTPVETANGTEGSWQLTPTPSGYYLLLPSSAVDARLDQYSGEAPNFFADLGLSVLVLGVGLFPTMFGARIRARTPRLES